MQFDMSPRDEWREEYNFVEWARAFSAGYGNRQRRMKRRRRSASQTPPSLRKKKQVRRDVYDLCKWHPKESHVMVSCSGVISSVEFPFGWGFGKCDSECASKFLCPPNFLLPIWLSAGYWGQGCLPATLRES
ncbi:hypothetical protein OIU79_022824 [Salix purpurea]|uniref:Uncharacterized protein n=1 Tax=Salix purpurea TaxID=77065 RepID=A0A9Q1AD88_SALPP|nr:hypothetical protein OIU79_022824 [Salix purpurea]